MGAIRIEENARSSHHHSEQNIIAVFDRVFGGPVEIRFDFRIDRILIRFFECHNKLQKGL